MYFDHFGLSEAPFRITPHTDFFFAGANRGATLDALLYAITHDEGIVKVSGEVGSGKTMLCRVLQMRLPQQIETVYIANPSVSPAEILHAIAFELQLPIARDAPRLEVMHAINHYLLERHALLHHVLHAVADDRGHVAIFHDVGFVTDAAVAGDHIRAAFLLVGWFRSRSS